MDYRFTDEENAFRQEVRSFLRSQLPEDWDFDPFELRDETWEFAKSFTKNLAAKGWIAPAWPKEYGGQELPFMKQVVLSEELAYHRAPNTALIGVTYAGPTMIVYGNEEQKREFIPGILSGDIVWCQGYSEPNAGSDLASLQMKAVKDGDDYVINGTKVWSSNAHKANWCFFLARTDPEAPKHKGISYFVTPMDAPGISVRPLVNLADEHVFNEIIFDNVRVPAKYLVGEENRGWYIGMTTLDFERSNISSAAQYRRTLEQLVEYVRESGQGSVDSGQSRPAASNGSGERRQGDRREGERREGERRQGDGSPPEGPERRESERRQGERREGERREGERETRGAGGIAQGKERSLRYALADLTVENQVGRYLSYRVASMQERGQIPNYESSAAKVFHSEYGQRLAQTGMNVMGLYGALREGSPYARLRGRFARTYLTSLGSTIAAGTSEIQRGIIAGRGLGLPRG